MKHQAARETADTRSEEPLSEAELKQVSGGLLAQSPFASKLRPPVTQWSGTPYQPDEDVEAY
jgi:bacteriocin-like protein